MKKLLAKDKKRRVEFSEIEKKIFILKSIYNNSNFFVLLRWKAYLQINNFILSNQFRFSNRCIESINKKRFNKITPFSRHVLLKLIRTGKLNDMRKASW